MLTALDIISRLKEIGLNVCALVSDMGSNNIQLANFLGVTPERPIKFGTSHLVKTVVNDLRKRNFLEENGSEISRKYIEDFCNHDNTTCGAPK